MSTLDISIYFTCRITPPHSASPSLHKPEFEELGLEPWESSLRGRPATSSSQQEADTGISQEFPTEETSLSGTTGIHIGVPPVLSGTAENLASSAAAAAADDERLCLVRLTDSLSRGVWPTYARLACALNLLSLRAMHAHLCNSLADLLRRREFRVRAPLSARVCGAVPFLPASDGGQGIASIAGEASVFPLKHEPRGGRGGILRDFGEPAEAVSGVGGAGLLATVNASSSSSTFYSAFLHPLYVWAQCLDRQFYAQVLFLFFS